jgi:hypothetical protein
LGGKPMRSEVQDAMDPRGRQRRIKEGSIRLYYHFFRIDKMSRIVYYYYFSKNVMQRYFCQSFTIQKPTIP